MPEIYKGYCYTEKTDTSYLPPATLNGPEEAVRYASLQRKFFPMVRIMDSDDHIVVEAKDGQFTFPQEFVGR